MTFFGLKPKDRANFFNEIHEIVFYGNGGYSWIDVYNMPIRIREFVYLKIKKFYEDKQEKEEEANVNSTPGKSGGKIKLPTYSVKSPNKK